MNINLNNIDEPRLTPPDVVYEHKASLKKTAVVPLYAKITAAAAAVALLFGLFWRPSSRPDQPMLAELKPIEASVMEAATSLSVTGDRAHFDIQAPKASSRAAGSVSKLSHEEALYEETSHGVAPREVAPLLATLAPCKAPALPSVAVPVQQLAVLHESTLLMANSLPLEEEGFVDGFANLLRQSWRSVKVELAQFNESIGDGFRQLKQIPAPPSFHSDPNYF